MGTDLRALSERSIGKNLDRLKNATLVNDRIQRELAAIAGKLEKEGRAYCGDRICIVDYGFNPEHTPHALNGKRVVYAEIDGSYFLTSAPVEPSAYPLDGFPEWLFVPATRPIRFERS